MSADLDGAAGTNRRAVLRGAVAVGLSAVAGTAFAACGGGDDNAAVQSSGGTGLSGGSGRTAGGPAPAPLTAVQITTTGGTITVA